MKVILKQDVKDLGKKDQVVNVSDGYGKNYLIPRGLAVAATEGQLKDAKFKQQAADEKKQRQIDEAKKLLEQLKDKVVVLKLKAGSEGRLFGSVSSKEIAEALKEQFGYEIDRKNLVVKDTIKNLGEYPVTAKVFPGISGEFKIRVESE